ncbi:MAG TPA: ATP-binding protein [Gemmatimonadaceae bacterium]|nr:ATP-binding protein [Gemmatimonadaceae bacterium]
MTEKRELIDLTNCDREPIHIPGSIQPHGVLLAMTEPELVVMQVSENVSDHLGIRTEDVLTRPLSALFDRSAVEAIRTALSGGPSERADTIRVPAGGKLFDGIVHRHEGAAILELEPSSSVSVDDMAHHPLRRTLIRVQDVSTVHELAAIVVEEVKRVTGFERVMFYRFNEVGDGSVDAESVAPGLEPYLGLHYPASDIPQQARQLYLKNRLRIIVDARYKPARIVPTLRPDTGAPLDLSFAVLRSVSPIHLEYMANMGLRASMSISLIVRDRLWGLISCANHTGPRHVAPDLRLACDFLGRLTSLQIDALEDQESAARRASSQATAATLADTMRTQDDERDNVLSSLLARSTELLQLVDAEGVAVMVGTEKPLTAGRTPPPEFIQEIAKWLDDRPSPFSTASLASQFPAAAAVKDVASGILTFALPGLPPRRVLWFRPEIVRTVTWGGDPGMPAKRDDSMRLRPRASFAAWKEEVRLKSHPWTDGDIAAAEDLRRYALEIDLERQVLRASRAVFARDELLAIVSHDLRNPLGVVQLDAANLKTFALPGDSDMSANLQSSADRILRAVGLMTRLIADLLDMAKVDADRLDVRKQSEASRGLIEEVLSILEPLANAKRITIRKELAETPPVSVDRDRIFYVLSNIIGNAIKFTPEGGMITLRTARRQDELLIIVEDSGPGIPPEQLDHVFDRFWRGRASPDGTGLGLYIAKGIVLAHGGRIWAEAADGGGSRFCFTLPLVAPAEQARVASG